MKQPFLPQIVRASWTRAVSTSLQAKEGNSSPERFWTRGSAQDFGWDVIFFRERDWMRVTQHTIQLHLKDRKGFKRQSRVQISLRRVLFLCFATALWVQVGENLSTHTIKRRNWGLFKGFAWHQGKFAGAPASVAQKVFSRWIWTGIRYSFNICIPFLCVMWRGILWSPSSSCSYPNCFMSKLQKRLKASSCSNFWRRKPN